MTTMANATENNCNANNDQAQTFRQPQLPPLYFAQDDEDTNSPLPAELLTQCLAQYADWGDLAKLACVQKSWSNVLLDAADYRPGSKWELARALLDGACGLQSNPKRAVELCYELASIETTEHACSTPTRAAARLPLHASAQCFAPAMKMIATCYFEGKGLPKDADAGMTWLQAAYSLGDDSDAAHNVALTYEYGQYGVETDVVAAAEWFEKAASAGHIEAMAELGLCYELGCGVDQSDEEALDWYTKAANAGHVTSKFSVAEAFEEARGVPQSDEEACLWYYRAAVLGDEDSKRALRRLYDIARIVCPGVNKILDV